MERSKSPEEYKVFTSQSSTGTSQSVSIPMATTPAEATFAKIAPLLTQGIGLIQHQHHPHHARHGQQQQPSHTDRLLMTAPSHHQKEQHEVLRVHQHQPQSVISVNPVDRSNMQIHQEYRVSSRSNSIEGRENGALIKTEGHEEAIQVAAFPSKFGFQTVLQVCLIFFCNRIPLNLITLLHFH